MMEIKNEVDMANIKGCGKSRTQVEKRKSHFRTMPYRIWQRLFLMLILSITHPMMAQTNRETPTARSDSSDRDSALVFSKASLARIGTAGRSLVWSRNAHWGAAAQSLLVPLIGYSKKTTFTGDRFSRGVEEQRRLSSLGYLMVIGSTASSVFSSYKVGEAGNDLYQLGHQFSPRLGTHLTAAGNDLRSYRNLSYFSTGTGFAAGLLVTSAVSSTTEDVNTGQFLTGLGLGVTSFVLRLIAVNKVGHAGKKISAFSQQLGADWQRQYFAKSGTNMQKYNKNWDRGLGMILGGIGLMVSGQAWSTSTDSQAFSRATAIAGGLMSLAGWIYQNGVAPADMGRAGMNLRDFQARMQQSDKMSTKDGGRE